MKPARAMARRWAAAVLLLLAPCAGAIAADEPAPGSVQAFVDLLEDPGVRAWLREQVADAAPARPEPAPPGREPTLQERLAAGVTLLRARGQSLLAAAPSLPAELDAALERIGAEVEGAGLAWAGGLILAFAAAGYLCQYAFARGTRRLRRKVLAADAATPATRLALVGSRLALALLSIMAFAIGSVGAFTLLAWPPTLKQVVLTALAAIVLTRGTWIVARLVTMPERPDLRLLPLNDAAAAFLHRWLRLLAAVAIGSWLLVQLLVTLGVAAAAIDLLAAGFGLVLLALALAMTWAAVPHIRAYRADDEAVALAERTWGVDDFLPITLSLILPAAWLLWSLDVAQPAATLLLLLALPAAIVVWGQIVEHVAGPAEPAPAAVAVFVERVGRSLLVLLAALGLLWIWGVDVLGLAGQETALGRLLAGLVKAVLLLALADIALQLLRLGFDRWLAHDTAATGPEEAGRRDRLRTLMPIVRNVVLVVVAMMAGLTVLASLGVQIGPLLAGAGVIGLAVGFGAQTLVKDIIAGFFFLLDDAFRVGEYIESGSYKGTVESFSLRSVKLRHQRGPLYTVPFGSLGAIVNHSRDWVIDRLYLNVTYDTDLDRVKAIVKRIGKELAADPAYAGDVLQPLKMQGVDQMGDFAIKLRPKMMTRPGRQFLIRRRAYALIKQAFAAEGIGFAVPTVQVRDAERGMAAAAAHLAGRGRTDAA